MVSEALLSPICLCFVTNLSPLRMWLACEYTARTHAYMCFEAMPSVNSA